MKISFVNKDKSNRALLLFFAGWGMDSSVFAGLHRDGYDIAVVWDYREITDFPLCADAYDEIAVMAWSMGVFFADIFMRRHPYLPFTKAVAVNGTLTPIDDLCGIPRRVYDLTTRLPNRDAVDKFYSRICGSDPDVLSRFIPTPPARDVEELRDELIAIRRHALAHGSSYVTDCNPWDEVIISGRDLIFPPANMRRAWESIAGRVDELPEAPHMIDFQTLAQRLFVDKHLVEERFASAADTYKADAVVQTKVAERLAQEVAKRYVPDTKNARRRLVIEVGTGAGLLTEKIASILSDCDIECWDITPVDVTRYGGVGNRFTSRQCDAEVAIKHLPDNSVDLLLSASTIQWLNSPRRFIGEVCRALRPGGQAFIAYYSKGTFSALSPHISLRYVDVRPTDIQRYGVEARIATERYLMTFDSPAEALRHIRRTGVNSLASTPMPPAETRALMARMKGDDGGAVLDFNTTYLIISKPDRYDTGN